MFKNITLTLIYNTKQFSLQPTTKDVMLKLLQEIYSANTVGIDNIGDKFLKEGATIFADPITKLCNLSIRLSDFQASAKLQN